MRRNPLNGALFHVRNSLIRKMPTLRSMECWLFLCEGWLPDLMKASQKHRCHFVQWSDSCLLLWGLKKIYPRGRSPCFNCIPRDIQKIEAHHGLPTLGKLWCGVSEIKSTKNLWNTLIRIWRNCHYSYDEGNRRIRITRFRIMTGTRIRSSQLRGTKQANIGESNILLWITAEEPIRKYWHHAQLWAWAQKTVVHNTVPLAKKEWSNSHSPYIDHHRYGRTISAGSHRAKKVWFKHYALTENRARRCKYCGTQAI